MYCNWSLLKHICYYKKSNKCNKHLYVCVFDIFFPLDCKKTCYGSKISKLTRLWPIFLVVPNVLVGFVMGHSGSCLEITGENIISILSVDFFFSTVVPPPPKTSQITRSHLGVNPSRDPLFWINVALEPLLCLDVRILPPHPSFLL